MKHTIRASIIQKAVDIVLDGGIIIYPTDTAFAIGCRMDNPQSVDRLFRIRKRSRKQATPVLVDGIDHASIYFDHPNDDVKQCMRQYWPGALTIISPCHEFLVYEPIRGGEKNIGLRMPDHDSALSIIRGVGVPILGPSANFHGDPTPYRFEDLDSDLCTLVDMVIPGDCSVGVASTIVDCSGKDIKILRQGSIYI